MEENRFERTHQQEENRFKRAYQEYQREKEALRAPRNNAGRFECLRSDNYVSYPREREFNRFSDNPKPQSSNDIIYLPRETFGKEPVKSEPIRTPEPVKPVAAPPPVVYLPRPTPKVETQVQRTLEPWKPRSAAPPKPPVLTMDSNYHFPELSKTTTKKIELPESKKEMITNPVIVPIRKSIMTVLSFDKTTHKLVQKELFEDGSEIPETGIVMIKKPNYSSWASVLKPELSETIYYDLDEKKIIESDND